VTVDEYQALPHGLAVLQTGDFHLSTAVPPLSHLLPAMAVRLTSARLAPGPFAGSVSTWQVGAQFQRENAGHYHEFFLVGRAVSLAVLLLTCLLTAGFARSLYGPAGGLMAAACVSLSPNLLAHGALVTPDVYLTAALVGSLWAFDRLLRRPEWAAAAALAVALAAASLAKFTGLLLFPLYPLVLAGLHLAGPWRPEPGAVPWRRRWLALAGALSAGVLVLNLGYLCDGSLTPLGDFHFSTRPFEFLQAHLPGRLLVPLPRYYFQGMDTQLAEEGYTAYLLGEFNETGFWSYYLVALLVKTPVPLLVLAGLALLCNRRVGRREVPLLVVAVVLLAFFSLARHKNIGVRYVLFLEPLAAVWVGRLAVAPLWQTARPSARRALAGVAATLLLAVAVLAWPDYLAYFNWVSGGPGQGHKYLLDSNLDWGQDLITLRRYMEREGIRSVDLAYFGRVDPAVYGVRYRHLGLGPPRRYVAISANLLWGRMYYINGTGYWPPHRDTYAAFRTLRPKAVLGHSLYVFDLAHV
jgi:hypothetical protein